MPGGQPLLESAFVDRPRVVIEEKRDLIPASEQMLNRRLVIGKISSRAHDEQDVQ
jgi:hypothetical protein